MKRFTLKETDQNLGATFCGDFGMTQDGKKETRLTLMQSEEELKLMWELHEDTECLEDGGLKTWRLGDLMTWFFSETKKCSDEELERRGWGDRKESGLGFRLGANEDGELLLMR